MRHEFLKNEDFISPLIEKPPEFEIRGYDDGPQNTLRQERMEEPQQEPQDDPQGEPQGQTPETPPTFQNDTPTEPQGPITEIEPLDPTPEPRKTKVPRMLRNLDSGLDGNAWACNNNHGPRYRIKRAEFEEEFQESWDNTRTVDTEIPQEDVVQ